jgi:hypothetical protein
MMAAMPLCWTRVCVLATILLVPIAASAQGIAVYATSPSAAPPPPLPPAPAAVPVTTAPAASSPVPQAQDNELAQPPPLYTRLRFEAGLEGNFTVAGNMGNYGFGNYLRLGVQVKDWIDTQAELSAGTILFTWYVRGAFTVGFTPVRWFTVSMGPVVGYFAGQGIDGGPTISEGYAGGTLRTDFHVAQYRTARGRRHSFTLGIAADVGGSFADPGANRNPALAVGGMFHIGYTAH